MSGLPSFSTWIPRAIPSLARGLLCLLIGQAVIAQPRLVATRENERTVKLSWDDPTGGFSIESSPALGPTALWQPVAAVPVMQGTARSIIVPITEQTRFYRLRGGPARTTVIGTSPAAGESSVAVTRETILHFSASLAPNTVLDGGRFYAEFGGRRLLARVELSRDRRQATLFYLENIPASARIKVTFDGNGLNDFSGAALDADGDGQPGGIATFTFDTLGNVAVPNTAIIGHVFASELAPDQLSGRDHPHQRTLRGPPGDEGEASGGPDVPTGRTDAGEQRESPR